MRLHRGKFVQEHFAFSVENDDGCSACAREGVRNFVYNILNFTEWIDANFIKYRSSRSQMFFKIGVLKNFANFIGTPVFESLFNKVTSLSCVCVSVGKKCSLLDSLSRPMLPFYSPWKHQKTKTTKWRMVLNGLRKFLNNLLCMEIFNKVLGSKSRKNFGLKHLWKKTWKRKIKDIHRTFSFQFHTKNSASQTLLLVRNQNIDQKMF